MPPNTANPLTGYVHGNLLEEGCIELTKMVLEKEKGIELIMREIAESGDDEEEDEEEGKDHENLHLKWTWTELKK
jgi:hypothetical protein